MERLTREQARALIAELSEEEKRMLAGMLAELKRARRRRDEYFDKEELQEDQMPGICELQVYRPRWGNLYQFGCERQPEVSDEDISIHWAGRHKTEGESEMNELRVFENNEFGRIRTIEQNGEPWFVAADVCRALELEQVTNAIRKLDDDEKALISIKGMSRGNDQTNIVNEPGLYSLVLGSRKPEAKAFKRWITHEVIPAIRKTGGYIAGEADMTDDELLSKALLVMQSKLAQREQRLQQLEADNSRLTVQNTIMVPKADYFDELVDRNLLTNFRTTAKQLNVPEKKFIKFLIDKKYIYRDAHGRLMPYAKKNDGLFEVKDGTNPKTGFAHHQTFITPKGKEVFRLLTEGM